MLRPITPPDAAEAIDLFLDGEPVRARPAETVAFLLLRLGRLPFRHTMASGAPRAAFCLMGACQDCLVEIDGQPNRQACLVLVTPGMRVRRQVAA
ncbi:(2Fe-2S)-binding protein [Humitalea sp. 24SJ18S-53]|uniref:(2Fe-2S)-binding protein n=1 Tax=Humitalea sp. 24SJ18S-53 TaxID=3422307 RepID=UPI003D675712